MTKLLRALSLMTAMAVLAGGATVAQDKKAEKKDDKKAEKKADDKKADEKKADDKKAEKKAATGAVVITKAKDGGFRYRVTGADGKTIAMPPAQKSWETREEVIKAIDDLKEVLKSKPVDDK